MQTTQITPELIQLEKNIESMERAIRRHDMKLDKLLKEIGYEPPETSESDKLSEMLELDRKLSKAMIAEGKALIVRAKNMTAEDMRRIGRAHLRRVNNRYRVQKSNQ